MYTNYQSVRNKLLMDYTSDFRQIDYLISYLKTDCQIEAHIRIKSLQPENVNAYIYQSTER